MKFVQKEVFYSITPAVTHCIFFLYLKSLYSALQQSTSINPKKKVSVQQSSLRVKFESLSLITPVFLIVKQNSFWTEEKNSNKCFIRNKIKTKVVNKLENRKAFLNHYFSSFSTNIKQIPF